MATVSKRKATNLGVKIGTKPVYAGPDGLKIGMKGTYADPAAALRQLPKGQRRQIRKAARIAGFFSIASAR